MQLLAISLFAASALAAPQARNPANPAYVTGFPVCNITGYTSVPGPYKQWTYRAQNTDIWECLGSCRNNKLCKSVSYNAVYTGCWHYDKPVNETQLNYDTTSAFSHFDLPCMPAPGSPRIHHSPQEQEPDLGYEPKSDCGCEEHCESDCDYGRDWDCDTDEENEHSFHEEECSIDDTSGQENKLSARNTASEPTPTAEELLEVAVLAVGRKLNDTHVELFGVWDTTTEAKVDNTTAKLSTGGVYGVIKLIAPIPNAFKDPTEAAGEKVDELVLVVLLMSARRLNDNTIELSGHFATTVFTLDKATAKLSTGETVAVALPPLTVTYDVYSGLKQKRSSQDGGCGCGNQTTSQEKKH